MEEGDIFYVLGLSSGRRSNVALIQIGLTPVRIRSLKPQTFKEKD